MYDNLSFVPSVHFVSRSQIRKQKISTRWDLCSPDGTAEISSWPRTLLWYVREQRRDLELFSVSPRERERERVEEKHEPNYVRHFTKNLNILCAPTIFTLELLLMDFCEMLQSWIASDASLLFTPWENWTKWICMKMRDIAQVFAWG